MSDTYQQILVFLLDDYSSVVPFKFKLYFVLFYTAEPDSKYSRP